jgi:Ala-tRNA(Pro) deacylase
MKLTPDKLRERIDSLGIKYESYSHPAVFTTADIALLPHALPGIDTKNLFLRDEKRTRYILVCVRAELRVDLKQLGRLLGMKGLTFGSPDELESFLGVSPGSVCLFSLANDKNNRVSGYIDSSIPLDLQMQNHPLINTQTLVLPVSGMLDFCASVGHPLTRVEIPERV